MPFRVAVAVDGNPAVPLEAGVHDIGRGWKGLIDPRDKVRKQIQVTVDPQARTAILCRLGINTTSVNGNDIPKDRIVPLHHNDTAVLVKDRTEERYRLVFLIHDGPDAPVVPIRPPRIRDSDEPKPVGDDEPRTDDEGADSDDDDPGMPGVPRRWRAEDFDAESDDLAPGLSDTEAPPKSAVPPRLASESTNLGSSLTQMSTLPVGPGRAYFVDSSLAARTPSTRASSPPVAPSSGATSARVASQVSVPAPPTPTPVVRPRAPPVGDEELARRLQAEEGGGEEEAPVASTSRAPVKKRGRPPAAAAAAPKGKEEAEVRTWTMETKEQTFERWRREREEKEKGKRGKKGEEKGKEGSGEGVAAGEEGGEGSTEKAAPAAKERPKKKEAAPKKTAKANGEGKSKTKTKRGVTAYGVFAARRRHELKKEHPHADSATITKLLKSAFAALPAAEKESLKQEAAARSSADASPSSSDADDAGDQGPSPPTLRRKAQPVAKRVGDRDTEDELDSGQETPRAASPVADAVTPQPTKRKAVAVAKRSEVSAFEAFLEEDEEETPLVKRRRGAVNGEAEPPPPAAVEPKPVERDEWPVSSGESRTSFKTAASQWRERNGDAVSAVSDSLRSRAEEPASWVMDAILPGSASRASGSKAASTQSSQAMEASSILDSILGVTASGSAAKSGGESASKMASRQPSQAMDASSILDSILGVSTSTSTSASSASTARRRAAVKSSVSSLGSQKSGDALAGVVMPWDLEWASVEVPGSSAGSKQASVVEEVKEEEEEEVVETSVELGVPPGGWGRGRGGGGARAAGGAAGAGTAGVEVKKTKRLLEDSDEE
ncbi:hypothetical protein HDU96_008092 [Phlyctochytrium bullatum]|nr:hypothetical protein HDU96_008092 [Phlyctochytrium bullatum]